MKIEKLLARRTDLSTFLVHLTRSKGSKDAKDRLKSILKAWQIKTKTPMGHAVESLEEEEDLETQRCVCFTETPLEHVSLSDDVLDVYRDLRRGLTIFDGDRPTAVADAVWEWRFHRDVHWGHHAVGALRAL